MMFKKFNSPEQYPILQEAKLARFQPPFIAQLGIFILLFIVSQIVSSVIIAVAMIPSLLRTMKPILENNPGGLSLNPENIMNTMGDPIVLVMLFSTFFVILLSILYCRLIEKRSLSSMGLARHNIMPDYLSGLLAGTFLFIAAILICLAFGAVKLETAGNFSIFYSILFFLAFLVQGMSEEVLCRGYFMISITNRNSVLFAIFANSLVFSLLHFFNPNVTVLALLNILLFGVFCSLYMLYFNSLWGVCALHSAWNFVQGNIFGSNVSGLLLDSRLFTMSHSNGYHWLSGGAFGMEGGIAMTVVLGIGIVMVGLMLCRRIGNKTIVN